MDDHVGVVDGAAGVALANQHGGGKRLDRYRVASGQPHVRQPADHAEVGVAPLELVEGGADDQLDRAAHTAGDPLGQEPVDGQHVRGQEGCEPQRNALAGRHGRPAGRWVSYMRTATTSPEAAVRAATAQTAATRPARSATTPATRAPTAKPASRHSR